VVPFDRGTLIFEIASIKELLPELWFPMTAIFGSGDTKVSVPQRWSILLISFNVSTESE